MCAAYRVMVFAAKVRELEDKQALVGHAVDRVERAVGPLILPAFLRAQPATIVLVGVGPGVRRAGGRQTRVGGEADVVAKQIPRRSFVVVAVAVEGQSGVCRGG